MRSSMRRRSPSRRARRSSYERRSLSSSSSGSSKEREAVKVQELAERLEEVERINAKLKKKEKEFKFTKGSHLEKKAASFRILSKSGLHPPPPSFWTPLG